jgi:hypothetical protein
MIRTLTAAQREYKKMMGTDQLECHYCDRSGVEFKQASGVGGTTIFVCADTDACKEAEHANGLAAAQRIIDRANEASRLCPTCGR